MVLRQRWSPHRLRIEALALIFDELVESVLESCGSLNFLYPSIQEAFNAAFRSMWTSEGNQQILIPVRELAAWIEANILLQLASAPFDNRMKR